MAADSESTFRIQARSDLGAFERERGETTKAERGPGTLAGEYVLKALLASGGHGSVYEAEQLWSAVRPLAVVLDLYLNGEDTWRWLEALKDSGERRATPVIIASEVADQDKAFALGADAYFVKPVVRDELLAALNSLCPAIR